MKEIIFSKDPYQMNWLRPDYPYAEVYTSKPLKVRTEHEKQGDLIRTQIFLKNEGKVPVFTTQNDIQISFPLEDRYEGSEICITKRCHTHIFCGKDISYIMALRMGGEAPHLGMVLTKGSLGGYSVKRDIARISNDRGCFLLHVSELEIQPDEEYILEWVIFSHDGKEDFYRQAEKYRDFVRIEADSYILEEGQTTKIQISVNFPAEYAVIDGMRVELQHGKGILEYTAESTGEKMLAVQVGDIHTWCRLLVQIPLWELAKRRSHFIVENQQYHGEYPGLKGAYLPYDNVENHVYYSDVYDYNGGRERSGMGLLLMEYMKKCSESEKAELKTSLDEHMSFVMRELVDVNTGTVFNDIGRDDHYKRLYNWTWYAALFIEYYKLTEKVEYLEYACRILRGFYKDGGKRFYPIELPVLSLTECLKKEGMQPEMEEMRGYFKEHADSLLDIGIYYPPSEVNYEQSIVGPAADILFQVYLLTKEKKYLAGGQEQLRILELFNGMQPDYHLYETAIRHWDGYWFGKKKLFGDTFPHYWSAVTGNVYALYYRITGDLSYRKKAVDSVRGVLPMFFEDGKASCAYLYPITVNGTEGSYWDEFSNDQDWGLYYNLRLNEWLGEKK